MAPKKSVNYHNRVRLVRTERGEYNLSMDLALRICDALDVSLDALFSMKPFAPLTSEQLIGDARN